MKKLIIIAFLLIAPQPVLFSMDSAGGSANQELAGLVDRDRMVHDFLHDHDRFKALWGQLPYEVGCAIAQKAIGLPFAMLKKEIAILAKELYGGHKQEIASTAFDHTGTLLLTTSKGTAKIWQVATRDCIHTFKDENQLNLNKAKFNQSGNLIVTQGDYTLIWDVATKACLHTLPFKKIETAKFNYTDDSMVITVFEGYDAIIYDMSARAYFALEHDYQVATAKFNRPGTLIATIGALDTSIGIVKVWDVATKMCVNTFLGVGPIHTAKFNHKGNMIAIFHRGTSEVNVHDSIAKTCCTLKNDGPIRTIQFNHADDMIVTSGRHTAKIWDIKTGTCLRTLQHKGWTHSMKFNQTDEILTTYLTDKIIQIWDVKTGACLHTKEDLWARRAKLNQTGDMFATTLMNGSAKIWDIGNYLVALKFLRRNLTLEQAMLLNCIYCVALQNRLLDMKYYCEESELKLDFNQFQHLQEYFMQLPQAIQQGLRKYVVLKLEDMHDTFGIDN